MKSLAPSLFLYLCCLLDAFSTRADAFRMYGVRTPRQDGGWSLGKRSSLAASSDLRNDGDLKYFTNITLNDEVFPVLIDTGSSDLYVAGNIQGAGNTNKTAKVSYAIGGASGPVLTAKMEFEEHTVMNQAFILDTSGNNPKGEGLIGLGPGKESNVRAALNGPNGAPPLDRIFRENTSTPNYITIYLGRSDDPTDPFPGDLTVGRVIDGFENITTMPHLPVYEVKANGGQHWQTLLDPDGVIGPDGNPVRVSSHVKDGGKDRLNVIFDSGFSLPQVPRAIADAFYLRVPGAQYSNVTGFGQVYTLPCDVELNVTFKFANISYPIHPLDTSLELGQTDEFGKPLCIGAFQPISANAESSTFDMILGMAFLRNAYLLVNFGDFVDGSTSKTADPYMQLLPLTEDLAEAHSDFVTVRLMGVDRTGDFHLLPASVLPPQDDSGNNDDDDNSFMHKIKPYLPWIIAGGSAIVLCLLISVAFCIVNRRRARYQRLHDPAPHGHSQYEPFERYEPSRRY